MTLDAHRSPIRLSAVRHWINKASNRTGEVALVLALIIGGSYFYEADKRADQEACQAKYNAAFTKSLDARSGASTARQDAVDSLLIGLTTLILASPTPTEEAKLAASSAANELVQPLRAEENLSEETVATVQGALTKLFQDYSVVSEDQQSAAARAFTELFQTYAKAKANNDVARAANPYPEVPSC